MAWLAARSFAQNGNKEAGRDVPADQKKTGTQLKSASESHNPCVRGQIFAKGSASCTACLVVLHNLAEHRAARVVERYTHLALENVRAALARLDETSSHFGHTEEMKEVS